MQECQICFEADGTELYVHPDMHQIIVCKDCLNQLIEDEEF